MSLKCSSSVTTASFKAIFHRPAATGRHWYLRVILLQNKHIKSSQFVKRGVAFQASVEKM